MLSLYTGRWKNTNEDRRVYQDRFGGDLRKCFLAIYDGHHGHFAADMAATELHHALVMELEKFDPHTKVTDNEEDVCEKDSRAQSGKDSSVSMRSRESTMMLEEIIKTAREDELKGKKTKNAKNLTVQNDNDKTKRGKDPFHDHMATAFKRAHEYTDKLLEWGKDENSRVRWSGCSTLACVIQDTGIKDSEVQDINSRESNSEGAAEPKVTFGVKPPKELGVIHLANAGKLLNIGVPIS